jgi:predicted nucleotidyltransferase
MEDSLQVVIEEKIANIPPLPGMVVLKLVAWSDRPEERENDLTDIIKIIEHYFEINFDEIVEFHNDTFPKEEELDPFLIAAQVLGRKACLYLNKSEKLAERIHTVINSNLKEKEESTIAKDWARKKEWEVAYAYSILKAFQKGLLDDIRIQ